MTISLALLKLQNAETSNAILEHYRNSDLFGKLAKFEGDLTVRRDQEDADKLQKGIDFAKSKGVIDPNFEPEPYISIDVLGKTPDEVASIILQECSNDDDDGTKKHGTVIVLVGLSGTGKGTTVSKLSAALEQKGKPVVTWSNGNIFRSVTLLAVTWWNSNNNNEGAFDVTKACSAENLQQFMTMLSFDKLEDTENKYSYDTRIHGLGLDLLVGRVQNTTLKAPNVASNIPAVAEFTQGEVILFAAKAVQTLCDAGVTVLLEGREQTVNYVRTPHRFSLVLSDESLIGKRRAAQRIMAAALEQCNKNKSSNSEGAEDVTAVVDQALEQMVKELH